MTQYYVHATAHYVFIVDAESEEDATNDVLCGPNDWAFIHKKEPSWEIDDVYPVKKK